jgi:mRNA interferase MazF
MNYGSLKRGEIYYVYKQDAASIGSEQEAGRPAIIVSNNIGNTHSSVVEIVFLTTKPKNELPTHVTIRSTNRVSVALCEQITTIDTCRLGDYVGTVSDFEMSQLELALVTSLGLETEVVAPAIDVPSYAHELQAAVIERDTYKKLYENLIEKLLN